MSRFVLGTQVVAILALASLAPLSAVAGSGNPVSLPSLFAIQDGTLYRAGTTGGYKQLSDAGELAGVTSFASDGGRYGYAIQADALWMLDLWTTDPYRRISSLDWSGPSRLTFGGGVLFAWQANYLYRVNPLNGDTHQLGRESWVGVRAMTYLDHPGDAEDLFVVQADSLWRTNVDTGRYRLLGRAGDWRDTLAMTSDSSHLYVAQNGRLWRASPENGQFVDLGPGWGGVTTMTFVQGWLYAIDSGSLYRVDPSNGDYVLVGRAGDWRGETFMTSIITTITPLPPNMLPFFG